MGWEKRPTCEGCGKPESALTIYNEMMLCGDCWHKLYLAEQESKMRVAKELFKKSK